MAMQKPSLDIIQKLTVIFGFVGTIFGVFFFLDDRHAHQAQTVKAFTEIQTDNMLTTLDLKREILQLDLKKDAESKKYYEDLVVSGKPLDEAQKMRKEYLENEMERKMDTIEKINDTALEIEQKNIE